MTVNIGSYITQKVLELPPQLEKDVKKGLQQHQL